MVSISQLNAFLAAGFLEALLFVDFLASGFLAAGFAWVFFFPLEVDFFRVCAVRLVFLAGFAGVDTPFEDVSSVSMSTP